jgi:hypothetical protein
MVTAQYKKGLQPTPVVRAAVFTQNGALDSAQWRLRVGRIRGRP